MAKRVFRYSNFFKSEQLVKIVCRSADTGAFEKNTEILSLEENRLGLEILGGGLTQREIVGIRGGVISVSGCSGYGLFRCKARFEELRNGRELFLRLVGDVEEQQRRDYFRMDVTLPLLSSIPAEQNYGRAKQLWAENRNRLLASPPPRMLPVGRAYQVLLPDGGIIPPQGVNLSGGGLRVRMPSSVSLGTLIHVDLFLPLAPPRVVTTTSQVLRCNEVTLSLEQEPVFITAMKFIHLDEKDREAIIAYLFAEQRIQLQFENGLQETSSLRQS